MKRFAILAAAAVFLPASALADTTVLTPKNAASKEEVAVYVAKLDAAVHRECQKLVGPVIGSAYYAFKSCLVQTRSVVARKDPTGLYAKSESLTATQVAAR
jgi:hypothetical protein